MLGSNDFGCIVRLLRLGFVAMTLSLPFSLERVLEKPALHNDRRYYDCWNGLYLVGQPWLSAVCYNKFMKCSLTLGCLIGFDGTVNLRNRMFGMGRCMRPLLLPSVQAPSVRRT